MTLSHHISSMEWLDSLPGFELEEENQQAVQILRPELRAELKKISGYLNRWGSRLDQLPSTEGLRMRKFFHSPSSKVMVIQGKHNWFVKFPSAQAEKKLMGEVIGAAIFYQLFQSDPYYRPCLATLVNFQHGYVVTLQLQGIRLSKFFYQNGIFPWKWKERDLLGQSFYHLGRILHQFHQQGHKVVPRLAPVNAFFEQRFKNALMRAARTHFYKVAWLLEWYRTVSFPAVVGRAVHRNLNLTNILVGGNRLSILDFETLGLGNALEDLGQLLGNILVMRAAVGFPRWPIKLAAEAFLEGYGNLDPFTQTDLSQYIALALANTYLRTFVLKTWPAHRALLPLSRQRLRAVTEELMAGHLHF